MIEKCFWDDDSYVPGELLQEDSSTKFLIIGAGVAGLFTAHFLLEGGVAPADVMVLERKSVGSGSTGHSAGILVSDIETAPWTKVAEVYGADLAALYYRAQKDALNEIEKLVTSESIACSFARQDYLVVSGDEVGKKSVISEFTMHSKLGESENALLSGVEFTDELKSEMYSMGERMERGITVNPLKFVRGIAEHLRRKGVRMYEQTPLLRAEGGIAETPHAKITFEHVVYAQGTAASHETLKNYATTIVVTEPLTAEQLEGMHLSDRDMFIDTDMPSFHYVKVTEDSRLLAGLGDTEIVTDASQVPLDVVMVGRLEEFLQRFSGQEIPIAFAWTGVFALAKKPLPVVATEGAKTVMAGMGTQAACVAVANFVAASLLHKEHPLVALFS